MFLINQNFKCPLARKFMVRETIILFPGTGGVTVMVFFYIYKAQFLNSVTAAAMALILGSLWILVRQVRADIKMSETAQNNEPLSSLDDDEHF